MVRGGQARRRRTRGLNPGRRRTDYNATTLSRKTMVLIVFVVDAIWIVGDALLFGSSCIIGC